MSAEKLAEKQSEVATLEEKVRGIERAAVGESGEGVRAAESRVAAAKLQVGGYPTAEAYLGSFRPSKVQQTHTDTDGMFSLTYPRDREFVLFARADGAVRAGNSEKCYWLVNAPSGRGDLWLQLSNDNLARADSEGRVQVLTTTPSQKPVRNSPPPGGRRERFQCKAGERCSYHFTSSASSLATPRPRAESGADCRQVGRDRIR